MEISTWKISVSFQIYSKLKTRILGINISTMPKWCVHAKSLQSCLTLCDPLDCSLPGCTVCGILQTRTLEQVVISSSRGFYQPRDWTHTSFVSCIGRQVLYLKCYLESQLKTTQPPKPKKHTALTFFSSPASTYGASVWLPTWH